MAVLNLASALIHLEQGEDAVAPLEEAIGHARQVGSRQVLGELMLAVATLAAPHDPVVAARLLGATEAILDSIGTAHGPAEENLKQRALAELGRLDPAAAAAAAAEGAQLQDEAADVALAYLGAARAPTS